MQGATPSCPRGCSKLLEGVEGPASGVMGSLGREVAAECWDADYRKVQEVAVGIVISIGTQQGMVPSWQQVSASPSRQFLEVVEVRGLLSSKGWLQAISGSFLQAECHKTPSEWSVGAMVHQPDSSHPILQPPSGKSGAAGP